MWGTSRIIAIAAVVVLAGVGAPARAADPDLAGEWHLDTVAFNNNQPTTPDSSDHGRDLNVAAVSAVPGKFGTALLFDGQNSDARRGPTAGLQLQRLTVMAWVKSTNPGGTYRYIVAEGATPACSAASFGLGTDANGGLGFFIYNGTDPAFHSPLVGPGIWDGAWHAVAATYDGAAVRLYVDGQQVGAGTPAHGSITYSLPYENFSVGNEETPCGSNNGYFGGTIDEVRVYDRALTSDEIHQLQTAPGPEPPELSPGGGGPGGGGPGGGGGTGSGGTAASVVARVAAPATVKAGALTTLDAGASTGADHYLWDLNGDGKTDVTCEQPGLQTRFLSGGAATRAVGTRSVGVTAVAADGTTSKAMTRVAVSGPSLSAAAKRVFEDSQSAACVASHNVATTPALRRCAFAVSWALIDAAGCLTHATNAASLPDAEAAAAVRDLVDQYNTEPALRSYVSGFCHMVGLTNCETMLHRRDLTGLLSAGAIDLYWSDGAVDIDGLRFTPRAGHAIVIAPQLEEIVSGSATVTLRGRTLLSGPLKLSFQDTTASLTYGDAHARRALIGNFDVSRALPSFGGLVASGLSPVSFVRGEDGRYTELRVSFGVSQLTLPDGSPPTLRQTQTLVVSNDHPLAARDVHGTLFDGVSFGDLSLGDVHVDFTANPDQRLQITASIGFGDKSLRLAPLPDGRFPDNGIVFKHGSSLPAAAGAELDFGDTPPEIFPGVDLDAIGFGIKTDPTVFRGHAKLGVLGFVDADGSLVAAFPSSAAPYSLDARDLPGLPDYLTKYQFTTLTVAVTGTGGVTIPLIHKTEPFVSGYFVYSVPGYVAFGAHLDVTFLDVVELKGGFDGQLNAANRRFSIGGGAEVRVADIPAGGGFGAISTAGAGGCLNIAGVSVGGGVQFPDHIYLWPLDGCKWSRFTDDHVFDGRSARIAQAGPLYTAQIKDGDPSRAIEFDGAGGAPLVQVTGPGGESLASPAGPGVAHAGHLRIVRSVQLGRTVVGLQDPAPGTYSFTLAPGSPRVTRIAHADDPAPVAISARVTGDGVSRVLRYEIAPRPDERVTFLDVGPQGAREIGTATGGHSGAIAFTPAPDGREHTIQAVVEYAGIPVPLSAPGAVQRPVVGRPVVGRAAAASRTARGRLVLARFRPPAPRHAGTARGLTARRATPNTIAISWKPARAAVRYLVVLRLGDGSTRTMRVTGSRHGVRLRGVAPTLAGRVSVRAIGTDGVPGRAARVRFRATARPRTAQRPFRRR